MTAFEKKCRNISEARGCELTMYVDSETKGEFEDDGSLHIRNGKGERACFDVSGTSDDNTAQNARVREIMGDLSLTIDDNVLIDDDDDVWPHWGS